MSRRTRNRERFLAKYGIEALGNANPLQHARDLETLERLKRPPVVLEPEPEPEPPAPPKVDPIIQAALDAPVVIRRGGWPKGKSRKEQSVGA